jgi:hypothetical protein
MGIRNEYRHGRWHFGDDGGDDRLGARELHGGILAYFTSTL